MIAGVAAGMAEYFHLDPTLVRLAWVLLLFAGPGLPVYLLAALIIPVEPAGSQPPAPAAPGAPESPDDGDGTPAGDGEGGAAGGEPRSGAGPQAEPAGPDGSRLFGWILIAVGGLFLLQRYTWIRWDHVWPLVLILSGLYLLVARAREPR